MRSRWYISSTFALPIYFPYFSIVKKNCLKEQFSRKIVYKELFSFYFTMNGIFFQYDYLFCLPFGG